MIESEGRFAAIPRGEGIVHLFSTVLERMATAFSTRTVIPTEGTLSVPDRHFYQPELDSLASIVFIYHCIPGEASFYKGWPHAVVAVEGSFHGKNLLWSLRHPSIDLGLCEAFSR
jgi:hypothetical protein